MDNTETINVVEWCAGYGGIGIGLKRVYGERVRTIAYSDVEGYCQANLISKMEAGLLDVAPIWPDIKTFPNGEFHGLVDILVAGFPCQPFSHAGKRGGDEDPRHLFPFIKRAAETMRPKLLFLENVEGILSAKLAGDGWNDPAGTPVLFHIFRELERVGYKSEAGIFSAAEVGAPHQRKRVFILAHQLNEGLEGHSGDVNREGRKPGGENRPTAAGGICGGPVWPSRPGEAQYPWEPPRVVGNARHDSAPAANAPGEVGRGATEFGVSGELKQRIIEGLREIEYEIKPCEECQRDGLDRYLITSGPSDSGLCCSVNGLREILAQSESRDTGEQAERKGREDIGGGGQEGVENTERFGRRGGNKSGAEVRGSEMPEVQIEGHGTLEEVGDTENNNRRGGECGTKTGTWPEGVGWRRPSSTSGSETQPSMGGVPNGPANGLDLSEYAGLGNQELVDIYSEMERTTNRTDELRMCGNGVVPATAELAWRTLYGKLCK